ncbi:MAG: hypothetical protein ABWX96_13820 [Propionibacteriaceae bacterium]
MAFVLIFDQIESRRRSDGVGEAIADLGWISTLLPFTRTAVDEFQGLLEEPLSVVTAMLALMRTSSWHIGLGIGAVATPLPADSRSARGPAFLAAREAVERAKREGSHVSIVAAPPAEEAGHDAEVVLRLVAALWEKRSPQGWDAVDLVRQGLSRTEAAERLQISRQAVGQRLQAAQWTGERDATPVVARLLGRADVIAGAEAGP